MTQGFDWEVTLQTGMAPDLEPVGFVTRGPDAAVVVDSISVDKVAV
jgi:hypothetical protein